MNKESLFLRTLSLACILKFQSQSTVFAVGGIRHEHGIQVYFRAVVTFLICSVTSLELFISRYKKEIAYQSLKYAKIKWQMLQYNF